MFTNWIPSPSYHTAIYLSPILFCRQPDSATRTHGPQPIHYPLGRRGFLPYVTNPRERASSCAVHGRTVLQDCNLLGGRGCCPSSSARLVISIMFCIFACGGSGTLGTPRARTSTGVPVVRAGVEHRPAGDVTVVAGSRQAG